VDAVCHRLGSMWNVFSLLEGAGWVKPMAGIAIGAGKIPTPPYQNLGWLLGATIARFMGGETWVEQAVRNPNRLTWQSAHGPTLSSTQMLPERSSMVNTSLS
jgi:hypothetical protein